MSMRRPRRTPPLQVWQNYHWRVELYKQKAGYVLWACRVETGPEEWSVFEDQVDARDEVRDYYCLGPSDEVPQHRLPPNQRRKSVPCP